MNVKQVVGLGLVGGVCVVVVAGVAATTMHTINQCAKVIDGVITHCVPLVDSLVDKILENGEGA